MPGSPIIQGGIFAVGLAVGVGTASLLLKKQQSTAPTAVAVPTSVPVPSAPFSSAGRAPSVPIFTDAAGLKMDPSVGSEVAREVFKYGFPGPTPDILKRTAYVAAYDRRLRHPSWTAEHLTAENLGKVPASTTPVIPMTAVPPAKEKGDRSRSQFIEDPDVPAMFRAQLKDYFRSGYDRGHMVPAADAKTSQKAMDETFYLTNIAPQVGEGFNRHYWAYVEDFCRRLTGNFEDVYVFTVPLYLPAQGPDGKWRVSYEMIGNPPNIAVPTHFAKVILTSRPQTTSFGLPAKSASNALTVSDAVRDVSVGAFVLPNAVIPDQVPLTSFQVPVETVEKAAGLTLFSPAVKASAKQLCRETKCEVIVRRFDDARKGQGKGGLIQGGRK
ncbi:nuclease [Naganishia albida]|nr:nuclease [Naganishia albida]